MLETYFVKSDTVDRIRASWVGPEVERYVAWLAEHGYTARSVLRRVPLVLGFGEFARAQGAGRVEDLPAYVEEFVAERVAAYRGAPGRRLSRRSSLWQERDPPPGRQGGPRAGRAAVVPRGSRLCRTRPARS
jgi:integrase/recombinase XerD